MNSMWRGCNIVTRTKPTFQETSRRPIMSLGLLAVFALFFYGLPLATSLGWFRHENVTVIAANHELGAAELPYFDDPCRNQSAGNPPKDRPKEAGHSHYFVSRGCSHGLPP